MNSVQRLLLIKPTKCLRKGREGAPRLNKHTTRSQQGTEYRSGLPPQNGGSLQGL